MLDPLTGALLTLDQIRAMTDELFAAHASYVDALFGPVPATSRR